MGQGVKAMAKLTKEQKIQRNKERKGQHDNKLTILMEKKKLGLIAQDQYDAEHAALIKEVYGEEEEE
jgi:hypothetical protein